MGSREGSRVLDDPLLNYSSHLDGGGNWFWNLGRDFTVLGHGSREGSHGGRGWVNWVRFWIWGISGEDVGRLGDTLLKGLFLMEGVGSWF